MTADAHFGRATQRILLWMAALGALAAGACWIFAGWPAAGGFAAGGLAGAANYRWIKQLVEALGEGGKKPKRPKTFAILFGFRYLLLIVGAYAILRYSPLNLSAALAGLFLPVGAVIAEMVYELIYGT